MVMEPGDTSLRQDGAWGRARWWTALAFVALAQVALIYWLSDRRPAVRREPAPSPTLGLLGPGAAGLLELTDPTLFALPGRRGLSGPAWLEPWRPELRAVDWTEPPRWLPLPVVELGGSLRAFLRTNESKPPSVPSRPLPELTQPGLTPVAFNEASRLRVGGDLAAPDLLTPIQLRDQEATDLLTNSIVQVLVSAAGAPVSATLLQRSGSPEADQFALQQARFARFRPLPAAEPPNSPSGALRWGTLTFEWSTVAPANPPATNAIAPAPQAGT